MVRCQPLQILEINGGAESCLQPVEVPMQEQVTDAEKLHDPEGGPHWSPSGQEVADPGLGRRDVSEEGVFKIQLCHCPALI